MYMKESSAFTNANEQHGVVNLRRIMKCNFHLNMRLYLMSEYNLSSVTGGAEHIALVQQ